MDTTDVDEQATAASNMTDREDSGRKREQAVVSRAAGVDKTTAASSRTDGEDSGREHEQAISREQGGGCGRTSNSSKQPTGQPDGEDIQRWQARARDQ